MFQMRVKKKWIDWFKLKNKWFCINFIYVFYNVCSAIKWYKESIIFPSEKAFDWQILKAFNGKGINRNEKIDSWKRGAEEQRWSEWKVGLFQGGEGGWEFSHIKGGIQAFISYNFFVHKISRMQIVHAKAF